MKRLGQSGSLNALLIPFILVSLLFLASLGFGVWAYMGMQDYKNNSDQKSDTAVKVAVVQTETKKDTEFAEKEKEPLTEYKGPAQFGALVVKYPKTWSAYVVESSQGNQPIDGYFQPGFVPNTGEEKNAYALRVEVLDQSYAQVAKTFDSNVKTGKIKASAYKLPNVPTALGMKFDGQISTDKRGSVVILPIRDKTLKIYTESENFLNDFNNIILKNLTFTP